MSSKSPSQRREFILCTDADDKIKDAQPSLFRCRP